MLKREDKIFALGGSPPTSSAEMPSAGRVEGGWIGGDAGGETYDSGVLCSEEGAGGFVSE